MKKHLFIAFAAAGLLASCSSNDDDFNAPGGNQSGINENEPVEILLGVGAKANVTTKGTGSVGADHNELTSLNLWNNELVNVYMFDQGTFDLASGDEGVIFDNALFRTPENTASGQARHMDKGVDPSWDYSTDGYKRNYYPMNGNFDFWAYRVDDANQKPQITTISTTTYTLDGSAEGYTATNQYVANTTNDVSSEIEAATKKTEAEILGEGGTTAVYSLVYSKTETTTTINGTTNKEYTITPTKGYDVLRNAADAALYVENTVADVSADIEVADQKTAAEILAIPANLSNYKIVFVKETFTPDAMTALVPEVATDKVTVPFSIDGSQDILAASTVLSDDDKAVLCGFADFATLKGNAVNYTSTGAGDETFNPANLVPESAAAKAWANYRKNVYSAKVARKDIQPNLSFKHMLTRLTFDAQAMLDVFAKGQDSEVRIKNIRVKSKTEGQLVATYDAQSVVAPETAPIGTALETTSNDYSWLELKARTHTTPGAPAYTDHNKSLVSLVEADNAVDPTNITDTDYYTAGIAIAKPTETATEIGEALLVIPEEGGIYDLEIEIEQTVPGREEADGTAIDKYKEIETGTIKNLKIYAPGYTVAAPVAFEAGKSYKVSLQVYGMTEIKVTTTLEEWGDGGNIDINPDDQL